MKLGYYYIKPYSLIADGKEIFGKTIHYVDLSNVEFLIEEYYGMPRTGYVLKQDLAPVD